MSLIIILARIVAIAASGVLLWSISTGTIETTKATGSDAHAIYALAAAVFVTAGVLGLAWSAKRYGLSLFLVACLISGEAYNFLKTAEREVAAREASQNANKNGLQTRETLEGNVAKAETAWINAQAAVADNAAKKGCVKECSKMLLGTVDSTAAGLTVAREALAAFKLPPSATPLADRSGVQAWMLDLLAAAFKSLAMNGLAAGLVAFGAHGVSVPTRKQALQVAQPEPARELPRIVVSDEPAISPEAIFEAKRAAALASDGGVTDEELATVAALFRGDIEPDGNGGGPGGGKVIRPRRWQRDEIRADLTERLAKGDGFPSQVAMSRMYGVPQSTLSNWFDQWSAEGREISRRQVGRRKMVG